MKAKSIKGNSPEEIKTALEKSMVDGFKPTLAVVFLSVKQDRNAISALLDKHGIGIFGATTNGEFIDEEMTIGSIAILLLEINPAYFTILFETCHDKNYRDITRAMSEKALKTFRKPAFLLAGSNLETDAEQLLFGFEDIVGKQVNVFGCMAGDDFNFSGQYVFTNEQSSDRGIVVIVLDEDKLLIKGRASCGWKPVGTERTVTHSEGNRVYTIDNIPALDITAKYGGIENISPENSNLLMEMATQFPLQLQRENGTVVMRPGLVVHWEDHSFSCSGSVPQGSKVRFSLPPDFDVIEKVIADCEDLQATEMPEADALILFSCAGRSVALGPLLSKEIAGIKNVWNAPLVGIFSNAELARATNGNLEMHNLTACCVAIKEK
jgi:hypothetical protein